MKNAIRHWRAVRAIRRAERQQGRENRRMAGEHAVERLRLRATLIAINVTAATDQSELCQGIEI